MSPEREDAWMTVIGNHWFLVFVGLIVLGSIGDWVVNVVRAARRR